MLMGLHLPTTVTHYGQAKNQRQLGWTECPCGWRTRKRRLGKRPSLIMFQPFHCPDCGKKLSENTAIFK